MMSFIKSLSPHARAQRATFKTAACLSALLIGLAGCRAPAPVAEADQQPEANQQVSPVAPEGSWRSELYGEDWTPPAEKTYAADKMIQDFSYAGYARGEKPVPSWENAPVLNVVDFGADPTGEKDSTTAIQQALHKAANYEEPVVVYLPEGTYLVSRPEGTTRCLLIHSSNTVLRGAGPDKTFILNTSISMRASQIIKVSPVKVPSWKDEEQPVSLITHDLTGPTTVIPVESTDGFKVGDTVIVGQDTTPEWIVERGEEDSWLGVEKKIGNIMYLRRLVKVDPDTNELTIDIPTRYTLKTRDNARVYAKTGLLENVGVEGFSIGNVEHPGEDGWESLDFTAPDSAYTKHLIIKYNLETAEAKNIKNANHVYLTFAIYINEVI
ncbi:MAG: glycosyl hydrolase family 28-related protein, partial [Puniceicoccales bacterium]